MIRLIKPTPPPQPVLSGAAQQKRGRPATGGKQAARKQAARKVPVRTATARLANDSDDGGEEGDWSRAGSAKRPRRSTMAGVDSLQQQQQYVDEWLTEKQELERQILEKNTIITKVLKDKEEEARQRALYQKERNEFEEKLDMWDKDYINIIIYQNHSMYSTYYFVFCYC